MTVSTQENPGAAQTASPALKEIASDVVRRAMQGGATAAEAVAMDGSEFSTVVRLGEVETLKESGSKAIGVRVFFGQRAASTYSSDLTPDGVRQMVDSALSLAKVTSETPSPEFRIRRNSANLRATSTFITTTSTRFPPLIALTMRAAPRRRPSTPIRGSSTPRAAASTRPSVIRCWPIRTVSSAITGARTARFRRCLSRRRKARPCSATTGIRWR